MVEEKHSAENLQICFKSVTCIKCTLLQDLGFWILHKLKHHKKLLSVAVLCVANEASMISATLQEVMKVFRGKFAIRLAFVKCCIGFACVG